MSSQSRNVAKSSEMQELRSMFRRGTARARTTRFAGGCSKEPEASASGSATIRRCSSGGAHRAESRHTTGGVHVNIDDLEFDPLTKGTSSGKRAKRHSHTLDGNLRGVHVDEDDFDTSAEGSGSRVMSMRAPCLSRLSERVTDVRKNSIADGCDQTARLR